jgi:DNA repair protein RecN (Recombination protein N)
VDEGRAEIVVRRVIARGGRTRAYVNGSLGTLALLRELAPHLLQVYGQDEHQALRRVESHRELLDAAGALGRTLDEMRARWARVVTARDALARARAEGEAATERAEMLRNQSEELMRANLIPGEEEALGAERGRLVHAERLAAIATGAEETLYSGEGAVVETLGRALASIRERSASTARSMRPARSSRARSPSSKRRARARPLRAQLTPDAARLEAVEERLAQLARLRRKYAGTIAELIRRRDDVGTELAQLAGEARSSSGSRPRSRRRAAPPPNGPAACPSSAGASRAT